MGPLGKSELLYQRYAVVTFVVEFGASGGTSQEAFACKLHLSPD